MHRPDEPTSYDVEDVCDMVLHLNKALGQFYDGEISLTELKNSMLDEDDLRVVKRVNAYATWQSPAGRAAA